MSKLVHPSVSDSFNASGSGPGNPANINWKMVLIYGGITITAVCVFGFIINQNQKQAFQLCLSQVKSMNEAHAASLAKKDEMMADLIKTIKKPETPSQTDQTTT